MGNFFKDIFGGFTGSLGGGLATGLLGGIFGGGKNHSDPNRLMGLSWDDLQRLEQQGRQYSDIGKGELGQYTNTAGQEQDAFDKLIAQYTNQSNGLTDQELSATQEDIGGNVGGAFDTARANLARNMAERGVVGSSSDVGGNMDLSGYEAAARGQALNSANRYSKERADAARGNIFDLIAGRRATALGRGTDLTGRGNNIFQDDRNYQRDLAFDQENRINDTNAAEDNGLANIFSSIKWGGGKKAPAGTGSFQNYAPGSSSPGPWAPRATANPFDAGTVGGQRPQDEFSDLIRRINGNGGRPVAY